MPIKLVTCAAMLLSLFKLCGFLVQIIVNKARFKNHSLEIDFFQLTTKPLLFRFIKSNLIYYYFSLLQGEMHPHFNL